MPKYYFCSICHEDFGDEIVALMCGHTFHGACIRDWQTRSKTCPECRRAFSKPPLKIHIQSREIDESTLPIVVELKKNLEEQILTASEAVDKLKQAEEIYRRCSELQKQQEDIEEENHYLKTVEQSLQDELGKLREELKKAEESTGAANTDNERYKHLEELSERDKQIHYLEKELRAKTLALEREIRNSTMLEQEKMSLQSESNMKFYWDRFQHDRRAKVDYCEAIVKKLTDEQFELFKSAKALYRYGYFTVFFNDNTIFARKTRDSAPIKIESKEHLESLIALSFRSNSPGAGKEYPAKG